MPGPLGHALAGVATAWSADVVAPPRSPAGARRRSLYARTGGAITIVCAVLAMSADVDLLFRSQHRSVTHSVGAVVAVGAVTAVGAWSSALPLARVVLTCSAAYASHLALDWLSADNSFPYGLRAFWPLSDRWYISGLNVFRQTTRVHPLSARSLAVNVKATAQEFVILAPIVLAVWLIREKAGARLSTESPGVDHAAK